MHERLWEALARAQRGRLWGLVVGQLLIACLLGLLVVWLLPLSSLGAFWPVGLILVGALLLSVGADRRVRTLRSALFAALSLLLVLVLGWLVVTLGRFVPIPFLLDGWLLVVGLVAGFIVGTQEAGRRARLLAPACGIAASVGPTLMAWLWYFQDFGGTGLLPSNLADPLFWFVVVKFVILAALAICCAACEALLGWALRFTPEWAFQRWGRGQPSAAQPGDPPLARQRLSRRTVVVGLVGLALAGGALPWLLRKGRVVYTGHSQNVLALAWSPDGTRIVSGGKDLTVQIWEAATGRQVVTIAVPFQVAPGVSALAWSPDGQQIAWGLYEGLVQSVQAQTGDEILSYPSQLGLQPSVAWSPDGQRLASGNLTGTVWIWETATGQVLVTADNGPDDAPGGTDTLPNPVAWSPDGHYLASVSGNTLVQVLEATSGRLVRTYHGHSGQVLALGWSPDGQRLSSAGEDGTVQLWESGTGRLLLSYRGHTGAVHAVAWSPDGRRLASGGTDGTVQVWEATTGQLTFTYQGHLLDADLLATVNVVAWSPDGQRIASGGYDNTVQVWTPE